MKKALFLSFTLLATPLFLYANEVSENYELAVSAFSSGDPNQAFIHLKNALQANPNHLPSKILLSKVYFDAGNIPAVEEELESSLEMGADINLVLPILGNALILQKKADDIFKLSSYQKEFSRDSQFEWNLFKGQAYLLKKDILMAQREFERAHQLIPDNDRGLNILATFYIGQKKFKQAGELIERSLAVSPSNERTLVLKGDLLLAQDQVNAAVQFYKQAFEIDPRDPRVLRSLTGAYLRLENNDAVGKYVDLILEQSSNDPTALLIKAILQSSGGEADVAKVSLSDLSAQITRATDNDLTRDTNLLFVQGVSEYLQGNYEKAQLMLESYLDGNPTDLNAMRILIDSYSKNNNYKAALDYLSVRKSLIADDLWLSMRLIQFYIEQNRVIDANLTLKSVKAKFADYPYVNFVEAQVFKSLGQPQAALNSLEELNFGDNELLHYKLLRGSLLLQVGRNKEALQIAERLTISAELSIDTLIFVSSVYLKNANPERALIYLNQLLEKDKDNLNALFNKALALKNLQRKDEATSILKALITDYPQHTPSQVLIARMAFEEGNFHAAIATADKILGYSPKDRNALEIKLRTYRADQNWLKALKVANKLNRNDRTNTRYIEENIDLLIRLERYPETSRYLGILEGLWSDRPEKMQRLANLQARSKQIDAAITTLEKTLLLTPGSQRIQSDLARLYIYNNEPSKAKSLIVQLTEKNPNDAVITVLRGDLLLALRRPEEAADLYRKALQLDSNNNSAIIKLYQLAKTNIDTREFIQLLEDRLNYTPDEHGVRKLLADTYLDQTNWKKAQAHYETLLAVPALTNDTIIINNLANIYALEDLTKAASLIRKAVDIDAQNPIVLDTYGWILAQQQHYKDALVYLREAYTLSASNPEIRYHLGYTLAKLGRQSEAIVELESAVKEGNIFADYQAAKNMLSELKQTKH